MPMDERYGKTDETNLILIRQYTFGQRNNVLDIGLEGKVNNISMPKEPTQEIIDLLAAVDFLPIVDVVYDKATHKLVADSWSSDGAEIKQNVGELTIAEQEAYQIVTAAENVSRIESEVETLANEKVDGHIDPAEKAHWMGVADALSRRHNLWLAEITTANIDQREADEVTFPPLTSDDHQTWSHLAIIQDLTAAIRSAAVGITTSLYQMTNEEINALPGDWVATHVLWP